MHPILAERPRQIVYLSSWIPIAALLTLILADGNPDNLAAAALLCAPMCGIYASICLGTWYACRVTPLTSNGLVRVFVTHGSAALVAAGLWWALGLVWTTALESFGRVRETELFQAQGSVIFFSGILLFGLVVAVNYVILSFESEKHAERKSLELKVMAREAELRALRAQIDPHFLFNALNSIGALTIGDPGRARQMTVLLADFFRKSLTFGSSDWIPLSDEIGLAEQFLEVERVRFGSRLKVERRVDVECHRCLVPPLILQPLVENAVKYGIASSLEGGTVVIEVRRSNGTLSIAVENPVDDDLPVKPGTGKGLVNVRSRVAAIYGSDGWVHVDHTPLRHRVEVQLPCSREHREAQRA